MRIKFNKNLKKRILHSVLAVSIGLGTFAPGLSVSAETTPAPVKLRIMETTDIHANIMNYDYYSLKEDNTIGLAKTATLIKNASAEEENTLLFDNGDLLQGSPLGDYVAKVRPWDSGSTHPIYDAMNLLGYDLGNYGNHEFNFGLDFLKKSTDTADFPYINANVYKYDGDTNPENDVNYFDPYKILTKEFVDANDQKHTIKVGVIGFVPPQITQWDKANLSGKVVTHDIKKTAEKFVPEMKSQGADIIVAIAHSGIGPVEYKEMEENETYQLSKVDGIDAILFGHTHTTFPGPSYAGISGVDNEKGTINGVAAVQPGFWGSHLGIIDLTLTQDSNGKWTVSDSKSSTRAIYDKDSKTSLVDADQEVLNAVKDDHDHTIAYVSGPVGKTSADIYSYFSQVKDDPSVQIVADAQKEYIENAIKGSEYDGLPVLSAAAPFKSGRDGSSDYTEIPAGDIAIKDSTSLYKYSNTVMALKLTGAEVKEWLEWTAGQFNTIEPNSSKEQMLVKPHTDFPGYNFDIIDGITYQIDVTKPQRYNNKGDEKISDSERIVNLQFNGKPIDPEQEFIVATNNYRATFTPIANPGGDNIIIESPDENRQVLVNYIRDNGTVNPSADNNWSFAPINKDVNVVFVSAPGAQKYAELTDDIQYAGAATDGYAKYSIDLNKNDKNDFYMTLMHTNDTHAHLESVARRITTIKDIRSNVDNSILLDAGDVFSGTLFFNKYQGQADVQFMNMIGYDAMVPGNHEFDKGPKVLADFIKKAEFPILSANIDYSKENELSGLFKNEIGKPGEGGKIYPASILSVGDEKVGVFGLTTEDTAILANPGKNLVFENYLEKAEQTVDLLEKAGVNKIVALTHLGNSFDQILAESVEGIDVIVGGHSHTKLDDAQVFNQDDEPTLVVQASEYANFLGHLELSFNETGILQTWNEDLINLNAEDENEEYIIAEDLEAAALLAELSAPIEELKKQIVGETQVFLDGERSNVRQRETNLGNLIADSMLAKAKEYIKTTTIAIQNGGGIRASIDEGEISLGEVLTTMPFGNTLVTLDLTGEEIVAALENGVGKVELGEGRFPQVAGLHFSFNRSLPAGQRVSDVFVETEDGMEMIDTKKTYTVATNAFIADGGDGYESFKKAKEDGRMKELFIVDYDVFTSYLNKVGTVTSEIEGRITELTDPVKPTIKVDGKKATATVDLDDVKKVPVNGALPIDLTEAQDYEIIEVSLSDEQLAFLKAQNASIQLFNNYVFLNIPASNLEDGAAIITLENLGPDEESLTDMYDFTIRQNDKFITTFEDVVTLGFTVDKDNTENPGIYYLNEEASEWELQESFYDEENGIVYADVEHFSIYTVLETETEDDNDNPGDDGSKDGSNPGSDKDDDKGTDDKESDDKSTDKGGKKLPNTATNMYNYLLVGVFLLLVGAGSLYIIQRRKSVR